MFFLKKDMDDNRMAVTPRGLKFIIAGVVVLIMGYVLLSGGGMQNPDIFNYDMFSWRRLVAAPLVMLAGFVIVAVAILGGFEKKKRQ